MKLLITQGFSDYELLDSGDGRRLERFGKYILVRPDPQIIWKPSLAASEWEKADARFIQRDRGDKGDTGDRWDKRENIPEKWEMTYKDVKFYAKLSPFKHTGIFPEQHLMWDFISDVIMNEVKNPKKSFANTQDDKPKILNLFAYTGIASLVAARAGASVTHVDASYPTIGWGRENQALSNMDDKPIRWILDDCTKFVEREIKRGVKYDAIIMDPPVYGHGPKGEVWDFLKSFPYLLELCKQVLTDEPLFFLVNAYAISASFLTLENVLRDMMKDYGGTVESGELIIEEKSAKRLLSTGIYARWSA